MTKDDLTKILTSLEISASEGINKDENINLFPRIVFWEIFWDFLQASSSNYNTVVTYQVSFFSRIPRDPKLLELVKAFLDKGIKVVVSHEYIQDERYFHSYFSVEVLENVASSN